MHLGGLLSTQEARVARGDSFTRYASFVLSNFPRASITPWLHAARLPFLSIISFLYWESVMRKVALVVDLDEGIANRLVSFKSVVLKWLLYL